MNHETSRFHARYYRVYFVLAGLLTVVIYAIYGANIVRWVNSPDFGWRTMYNSGPNIVAEVMEKGRDAGLKPGDTIKAINGKEYTTFDALFFTIRNNEPGSKNKYTVIRDGQTKEITITTGRLGLKSVLARSGPVFVIGLIYVFIGVIVFLMKPFATESWLFFIMTCFFGISISYSAPSDLMKPLWIYKVRLFIDVILPAPMIHLAFRFPKKRTFLFKKPWLRFVPYLISFVIFALYMASYESYWNSPPALDLINDSYLMLAIIIFLTLTVWNRFKDSSVMVRLQSQVILLGIFLGFFVPASDLLLRSFSNVYLFPSPAIGFAVFLTFFPLSIGYTIVKHDLFEFDSIIKRTYGYILTSGSIGVVYAVFILISNLAFGQFEVTKSPLFPLVFIFGIVFFFNPIKNRVQKFIDRVFYRLEYDYQKTVQKISETMRSLLKLDEIVKNIINTAVNTMFIETGCVMLLNQSSKAYECLAGEMAIQNQDPSCLMLTADEPIVQKMAERKKEITVYDLEADPFFEDRREACKRAFDQLKATLMIPLIYEDNLIGLISLGQKKSGKFYRSADISLLNTLANQGAVAIENALMIEKVIETERMEEELSIARELQASMLPTDCPQIKGLQIAAVSLSAREVGGDFYDFIDMGDKSVGLLIGDVTGKGVSGALVMSASMSIFRMLSEENLTIDNIMKQANKRTQKDIKTGMFVALLYAVFNAEDNTLKLCSAGQTQPVHLSSRTGKAGLIETIGDTFPLGLLEDVDYKETSINLHAGDKVVFYTDGIVEAMNEKQQLFGFERLIDEVQKSGFIPADQILENIVQRVTVFEQGLSQHDDLTVIVVSVGE